MSRSVLGVEQATTTVAAGLLVAASHGSALDCTAAAAPVTAEMMIMNAVELMIMKGEGAGSRRKSRVNLTYTSRDFSLPKKKYPLPLPVGVPPHDVDHG
jgi:hypothetical protein